MVKYSKKNGALFDRRFLSRTFEKKNARPDAECWELDSFIRSVSIGCGFEAKTWGDIVDFVRRYECTPWGYFQIWFEDERRSPKSWPVCENRNGKPHFAWFKQTQSPSGIGYTLQVWLWEEMRPWVGWVAGN